MDAETTNSGTTNPGIMTASDFSASDHRWRNCFVSSTLLWMSDNDPKTGTVQEIVEKFQAVSDAAPALSRTAEADPAAASHDSPGRGPLQWRIGTVHDFRGIDLPAAGERLTRWEISKPREVFKNGIISLAERFSRENPDYAVSDIDDLKDPVAELRGYVRHNKPSVFVSTSRTGIDRETGLPTRVAPDSVDDVIKRYEYEIFVHGGVDVKRSGEFGTNFNKDDEEEISLPGGIRPEFIRSVRKYRTKDGVAGIPKIWENPYFNPSANGLGKDFKVASLPDIVDPESKAIVRQWPRPRNVRKGSHIAGADSDELSEDSDDFEDDPHPVDRPARPVPSPVKYWKTEEDKTASMKPVRMTRGAFTRGDGSQIWFVNGCLMVLEKEKEQSQPKPIAEYWPGLLQAGITRIDAILSTPAMYEKKRLFLFRGYHCAQIQADTGDVVDGPVRKIREAWPPLNEAGIGIVDAVLAYPAPSTSFAFFSRNRYALIKFEFEKGSEQSTLIDSGEMASRWPVLEGLNSIDCALVDQEDRSKVHFASGGGGKVADLGPDGIVGTIAAVDESGIAALSMEEAGEDMDSIGLESEIEEVQPRGAYFELASTEHPEAETGRVELRMAKELKGAEPTRRVKAEARANAAREARDGASSGGHFGGYRNVAAIGQSYMVADKWTALRSVGFY